MQPSPSPHAADYNRHFVSIERGNSFAAKQFMVQHGSVGRPRCSRSSAICFVAKEISGTSAVLAWQLYRTCDRAIGVPFAAECGGAFA
jgi:hypothetical protein